MGDLFVNPLEIAAGMIRSDLGFLRSGHGGGNTSQLLQERALLVPGESAAMGLRLGTGLLIDLGDSPHFLVVLGPADVAILQCVINLVTRDSDLSIEVAQIMARIIL